MKVNGEYHTPATLLLAKNPGTPWIRGWVGPRAIPDILDKRHLFLSMVISVLYKYTASTFSAEMS